MLSVLMLLYGIAAGVFVFQLFRVCLNLRDTANHLERTARNCKRAADDLHEINVVLDRILENLGG